MRACLSSVSNLINPLPSVINILLGCLRSLILTCFVNDMLDSAADISRLQRVRSRKVLSTPLSPCYLVSLSYTKTPNCLCVVLILYLVWMCAAGASSCPPYKCLRTFLHKSLLYLPQRCMPFCVMKLTFFVSLPLLAFYTTFFRL